MNYSSNFAKALKKQFRLLVALLFVTGSIFFPLNKACATELNKGEKIFIENCSGCHVNGGNIIRRSKTLKLKALQRRGIDNPEAIKEIVRLGTGIMSGYGDSLGKNNDQIVANWVWEQAQKAWTQG